MSRSTTSGRAAAFALLTLSTVGKATAIPERVNSPAAINDLGKMSNGIEAVTDQTLRCVVKIMADTYLPDQGYCNEAVQESDNAATATSTEGSGILVSSDGYIVTNAHVVSGERNLRVITHPAGVNIEVKGVGIVGIDKATDLAVLRIPMDKLPFIHLDDATPANQGILSPTRYPHGVVIAARSSTLASAVARCRSTTLSTR